jgi:hypothetical protein
MTNPFANWKSLDAKLRERIAKADREQNIRPVARLPAAKRQCDDVGDATKGDANEGGSPRRVVISFVCFRTRTCDDDNLQFGCKWLRDAIATSLGIDDGDKRLRWQYQQLKTDGPEGVTVTIQIL